MARNLIATWGIIVFLLASVYGTVAAQSDTATETPTGSPTLTETVAPTATPLPSATPTVVGTLSAAPTTQSKYYNHPVVQILSAYFGRDQATATPTAVPLATPDPLVSVDLNATPDPLATVDPLATPGATETPAAPVDLAQQIAQYHEDGLGFGVLVKLYAMAEASAEKCTTPLDPAAPAGTAACTVVTVDELVTQFQGGAGMGQLFEEYGKPALLGVGHVKQELKKGDDNQVEDPTLTSTPSPEDLQVEDQDDQDKKDKEDKEDKEDKADKADKADKSSKDEKTNKGNQGNNQPPTKPKKNK